MRQSLFFSVLFAGMILFQSCVNEDDFDFDRLSQTTINPSIGVPLFETKALFRDFLDLDSLAEGQEGLEVVTRHDADGDFLELSYTRADTFDVLGFVKEIENVQNVEIDLPALSIPDVSSIASSGIDVSDMTVQYPAEELPSEDISLLLDEFEEDVSIDSLLLRSGGLTISANTNLPFNTYIELSSSSLRDNTTGRFYSQRFQIASPSGALQGQTLDLRNYTILLKDSTENSGEQYIDLRYRVIVELGSNTACTGGDYGVGVNIDVTPLSIELAYGKVGKAVVPVSDTLDFDLFTDESISNFIEEGGIDLEKLTFDIYAETNIGLGAYIVPDVYSLTATGKKTDFFTHYDTLHIERSPRPGQWGITTRQSLETDASAIEVLPEKVVYNLDIVFSDALHSGDFPAFVRPHDAVINLKTCTTIPIKARLTDLYYEDTTSSLDFTDDIDFLKSATLTLFVENEIPASLELNFLLLDENERVFDTLFAKPVKMKGAPVDANGNALSPVGETISANLTAEKYEQLKKANKVKSAFKLNSSADSNGNRPYIRFRQDAAVRIKARVKAVTDFSF